MRAQLRFLFYGSAFKRAQPASRPGAQAALAMPQLHECPKAEQLSCPGLGSGGALAACQAPQGDSAAAAPPRAAAGAGGGGRGGGPGSRGSFPARQRHLRAAAFPGRRAAAPARPAAGAGSSPELSAPRLPREGSGESSALWPLLAGSCRGCRAPVCAGSAAASSPVRCRRRGKLS